MGPMTTVSSPGSGPVSRLSGAARALALEIAAEARAEWAYTSDIIATAFRQHRELPSRDRRLVAETVYGVVRWDRRLDAIVDELLASRRDRREVPGPAALGELKLIAYELQQGLPAEAAKADVRRILRSETDPTPMAS